MILLFLHYFGAAFLPDSMLRKHTVVLEKVPAIGVLVFAVFGTIWLFFRPKMVHFERRNELSKKELFEGIKNGILSRNSGVTVTHGLESCFSAAFVALLWLITTVLVSCIIIVISTVNPPIPPPPLE